MWKIFHIEVHPEERVAAIDERQPPALCEHLSFLSCQFGVWRLIDDGTVKPLFIVMLNVIGHDAASLLDRFSVFFANAIALDRSGIPLDLAVALRR